MNELSEDSRQKIGRKNQPLMGPETIRDLFFEFHEMLSLDHTGSSKMFDDRQNLIKRMVFANH